MTKEAKQTPPGLAFVETNIRERGNVLGAARGSRAAWAKGRHFNADQGSIFFSGCGYQYGAQVECLTSLLKKLDKSALGADLPLSLGGLAQGFGLNPALLYTKLFARRREEGVPLKAAVAVLQALGRDVGYLGEAEPCCGALLHFMGHEETFAKNTVRAYEVFKEHGVREIISIVPSCTHALRDLMPRHVPGWDITVRHFSEVVAEDLKTRRGHWPEPQKVTFHDPCQLGRFFGVYDAPRTIIGAVDNLELVEPEGTSGEYSTCCGGGAGFETIFPELAEIIGANRARELADTGAGLILTQCPGCIAQLRDGLKTIYREDIEILDLAEVAARALEVAV